MKSSHVLDVEPERPSAIALAIDGSEKSKYIVRWALKKMVPQGHVFFKLIHVRPKVTSVPTPMGNFVPIDRVRDDVAAAYRKEIDWQANEKLLPYKQFLTKNKILVEIVQVESDDVVQGILGEVTRHNINKLLIGASSSSIFSRGKKLSSRISQACPTFCTVYVISKGNLSSVRSAVSETSASHTDDNSDLSFSTDTSSLHDYSSQTGSFKTGDGDDEQSSGRTFSEVNEAYTAASSFRSFPDHDQRWMNYQGSYLGSSSEYQVDMSFELEKIRLELQHHREMTEMAQNEAKDASRKLNDLSFKMEEAARFRDVTHKEEEARVNAEEDKEKYEAAKREADYAAQCAEREAARFRDVTHKEEEARENAEEDKEKYEAAKREADYAAQCAEREASQIREADAKALHEAEEKEMLEEDHSYQYRRFTWDEIVIATSSFSENLRVGMGSYGTVYKGNFHHTTGAVKVRHSKDGYQLKQFHQELKILSKIRHPHLLSLLGACPEHGCLVYEFLENGSLEECLLKKNNSPLLWFERCRIAWEVATALVYLHTSTPTPIIHRDLKPANILLDRNLLSKIGDVGLSTMMQSDSPSALMSYKNTGPVGTFCYIDPEYQRTGVLLPKSDVYAFGIVMLQLLTAKPAVGLAHLVEKAVENNSLIHVLDQEAGEWPIEETKELVLLALRCTELRSRDRPDLQDEVLPVLEKVKDIANKARDCTPNVPPLPPNHFICPISKELMEEPYVCADGYTFERKAIEEWLENNEKSPMTNLTLPHKHLLPNYTLLAAITDWRSQNP